MKNYFLPFFIFAVLLSACALRTKNDPSVSDTTSASHSPIPNHDFHWQYFSLSMQDRKEKNDSAWRALNDSISLSKKIKDEDLVGYILPNLDDSTLLKVMYGSYKFTDTTYWIGSRDIEKEKKSYVSRVYSNPYNGMMTDRSVDDIFEINEHVRVIFMSGSMSYAWSHDFRLESAIICVKNIRGWRIADFYRDKDRIDLAKRELAGNNGNEWTFCLYYEETEHSAADTAYETVKNYKFPKEEE
ncbi:MAG: hypothetical protein HY064_01580 [Bacteroidetes bacterium]|nr:hypothetical protein [Bacteroidota bacterium]